MMTPILQYIKNLLTKRVLYHLLCWSTILFLLMWDEMRRNQIGFRDSLENEIINIPFYAIIYYFNTAFLIPNYLNQQKIWTYLGLLFTSAILITPIRLVALFMKFSGNPDERANLIAHQYEYFLVSLIVAGGSTIVKITNDWAKQSRDRDELEQRTMQSELNFLKSQINPHFLFNTLNSLYALTLKKSDEAPEIVIKLSEMMRYMLYECNEKQVSLDKEVNYLRNYLDLERLRQGKSGEVSFELKGDPDGKKIAPLLFIPFVENSFKHGFMHSINKGYVHIRLEIGKKDLTLYVENSKPESRPNPDHRKSGGVGLTNVCRRLELLYPKKYDIKMENNPDSYEVRLWLDTSY